MVSKENTRKGRAHQNEPSHHVPQTVFQNRKTNQALAHRRDKPHVKRYTEKYSPNDTVLNTEDLRLSFLQCEKKLQTMPAARRLCIDIPPMEKHGILYDSQAKARTS